MNREKPIDILAFYLKCPKEELIAHLDLLVVTRKPIFIEREDKDDSISLGLADDHETLVYHTGRGLSGSILLKELFEYKGDEDFAQFIEAIGGIIHNDDYPLIVKVLVIALTTKKKERLGKKGGYRVKYDEPHDRITIFEDKDICAMINFDKKEVMKFLALYK